MSCIAANTADDVGSEVLLLRTVIFTMTDLSTVLTSLVLIITQCSVEGGKFTELVPLQFVLAFRDGGSLSWLVKDENRELLLELTVSITLWMSFLALLTFSSVSAIIRQ